MFWIIAILLVIIAIIYSLLPSAIQVILYIIVVVAVIALIIKFALFLREIFEPKDRIQVWGWIILVILVAIGSWLALYFPYWLASSKL